MENKNNEDQLKIELSEGVAEGVYSNLAIITHSSSEFILDFIRVMPGVDHATVKSRVILAPEHAKRLLHAMADNVARYERKFGVIQIDEPPMPPFNLMQGEA